MTQFQQNNILETVINKIMASLTLNIAPCKTSKKIVIELDANKFERLAADFGFFNSEFLASLSRAEKDYTSGKVRKIKFLKELRSQF